MSLKRFAGLSWNKRLLLIAAFAVAIVAAVSTVPPLQRMLGRAYAQTSPALYLNGNVVVQASGTVFFYTPAGANGTTEVLHVTMAGSAYFVEGTNTATNLILNLGGEDDYSSDGEYNELICYLTQPGDLFYTPIASNGAPAMLTVTYHNGDKCGNPAGISNSGIGPGNGGVSEMGKVIPFNFYPTAPGGGTNGPGGVIISNYDYLTTGGTISGNYPNGWNDGGSSFASGTHVAYGFSVTGQVTPVALTHQ